MTGMSNSARAAAAAFVLGLSLAGPQALGVAAADSDSDATSVSSGTPDRPGGSARQESAPRRGGPAVDRSGDEGAASSTSAQSPGTAIDPLEDADLIPVPSEAVSSDEPAVASEEPSTASKPIGAIDDQGPDGRAPRAEVTNEPDGAAVNQEIGQPAAGPDAPVPASPASDAGANRTPANRALANRATPANTPAAQTITVITAPQSAAPLPELPAPADLLDVPANIKTALTAAVPTASRGRAVPAAAVDGVPPGVAAVLSPTVAPGAAPVALPVPPVIGKAMTAIRDEINTATDALFNGMANFLIDLPAGGVTSFLEGALMLVRKTFFNQAPEVTPSTPRITGLDGTLTGRIGATDLEGDELVYSLAAAPKFGTVRLGADGTYAYTPGPDYAGEDAFAIQVTASRDTFNLLTPFANNDSSVVTINVGAPAATTPFQDWSGPTDQNVADVAVFLSDASGRVNIQKSGWLGNQFSGTVTLTGATPDTKVSWIDSSGNLGDVSLEEVADLWPQFKDKAIDNGGEVSLGVSYTAADGTERTLLLSGGSVSKNSSGQYVFTGQLSPNLAEEPDSIDMWDVIGPRFQSQYQDFRTAYGITDSPTAAFTPVQADFEQATFFAYTYSPVSYLQDGLYAFDNPDAGDASGTPAAATTAATSSLLGLSSSTAESATSPVTASIPLGQSFVIGRGDGSVELWTDGQKQLLQTPGEKSSVKFITDYKRPLQDLDGTTVPSSFTGFIQGKTLTVTALAPGSSVAFGKQISGPGITPGTTITAIDGADAATGLGTYGLNTTQWVGPTTMTQPENTATAPGFIVGLNDGSVRLWSVTDGWTELLGPGTQVTAMTAYDAGVVIGLSNGAIGKWDGPGTSPDPQTWKNNWTVLQTQSNRGQSVRSILTVPGATPEGSGIVVALGKSPTAYSFEYVPAVQHWDPASGWTLLQSRQSPDITVMTPYGGGVAVGDSDGTIQYWDGTVGTDQGWTQLQGPGWGQAVTTMVPYNFGLVVGLGGKGAVYRFQPTRTNPADVSARDYRNGSWVQLHDTGWSSPVTTMTPYETLYGGPYGSRGVVVGLGNGSVQLWSDGQLFSGGNAPWTELHDAGWSSPVATIIQTPRNVTDSQGDVLELGGVVVGLANGSVQQWSGLLSGKTGQDDWTQIVCGPAGCTPGVPTADGPLLSRAALEAAVKFGIGLAQDGMGGAEFGTAGAVGSAADPLFGQGYLLPACVVQTCDGSLHAFAVYLPYSPLKKELTPDDTTLGAIVPSVTLGMDSNLLTYGYMYVPKGWYDKTKPGKYSVAALTAVQVGPSITAEVGSGGAVTLAKTKLFNYQATTPGPLGADRADLNVGVDAELKAKLICDDDSCPPLEAHAYLVPGVLVAYNTIARPGDVRLGANYYTDVDVSGIPDGVVVSATLDPYASVGYGLFTPDSWPVIGGWTLAKLNGTYSNPVTATVSAEKDKGASLKLNAKGYVEPKVALIPSLTSKLTYSWDFDLYDQSLTYTLV